MSHAISTGSAKRSPNPIPQVSLKFTRIGLNGPNAINSVMVGFRLEQEIARWKRSVKIPSKSREGSATQSNVKHFLDSGQQLATSQEKGAIKFFYHQYLSIMLIHNL